MHLVRHWLASKTSSFGNQTISSDCIGGDSRTNLCFLHVLWRSRIIHAMPSSCPLYILQWDIPLGADSFVAALHHPWSPGSFHSSSARDVAVPDRSPNLKFMDSYTSSWMIGKQFPTWIWVPGIAMVTVWLYFICLWWRSVEVRSLTFHVLFVVIQNYKL